MRKVENLVQGQVGERRRRTVSMAACGREKEAGLPSRWERERSRAVSTAGGRNKEGGLSQWQQVGEMKKAGCLDGSR